MLESLTSGFKNARLKLQGKIELNEENLGEAIETVKISLLEADVGYHVVNSFLDNVKKKALGSIIDYKVNFKDKKLKISPSDLFIKICNDELVNLMGPQNVELFFDKEKPTIIMLVGLQGSGKTTQAAKLALFLKNNKRRKPILAPCDVYRPAAIEQLSILANRINIPIYKEDSKSPVSICKNAFNYARDNAFDTVIFDTAGRHVLDDVLMNELDQIKTNTNPQNILLVCDAMIGQDSVRIAESFDKRLNLTGFILTKLDGDTRGGALVSIKHVTGKPIKFIGIGETLDKLEEFRPEGYASRILGFGDVVGLVADFEKVIDEKKAEEDAQKMLLGKFTLDDFLTQIKMIKKMGPLQDIISKMPFAGELPPDFVVDDKELVKIESIISSMTQKERTRPDIVNLSRIERIAKGSGRKSKDVSDLLSKFFTARKMMANLNKGMFNKLPGIKHLRKLGDGLFDIVGELPEDIFKKEPIVNRPKGLSFDEKRRLRNLKKRERRR
jgi:signal recognition particle subunit SRP54